MFKKEELGPTRDQENSQGEEMIGGWLRSHSQVRERVLYMGEQTTCIMTKKL